MLTPEFSEPGISTVYLDTENRDYKNVKMILNPGDKSNKESRNFVSSANWNYLQIDGPFYFSFLSPNIHLV